MGQKAEVKVHCQTRKGGYIIVFEEQEPKKWVGIEYKPLPKASFFDRLLGPRTGGGSSMQNMQGDFYTPDLKCPICGNNSYVKCGTCGELTCWKWGEKWFKCGAGKCTGEGEVSGTITDLDGSAGANTDDVGPSRSNGGSSLWR